MSHPPPSSLPRFDRLLLRGIGSLVPAGQRAEWARAWEAELWYVHHRQSLRGNAHRRGLHWRNRAVSLIALAGRAWAAHIDLAVGVLCDALWLRADSWRRACTGTATFRLASLVGLCAISFLIALTTAGGWDELRPHLVAQFQRFLLAAPLVIFVSFATIARRRTEYGGVKRAVLWFRRQMFFWSMMALVLLLAFLSSADLCEPMHRALPGTADLLQIFCFVVLGLAGLRWAFRDLEERCEQCLRALSSPARVGRPTHNLLEWSGTEQICKDGHGLLSVPEMESSWRQSSQWVQGAVP
jgi:hypothetical protein